MKDFGQWLADAGKGETEEVDDTIYLTCISCGRTEYVSLAEYENGDTGWLVDLESGEGLCGGGQFCLP
jgi:hypothetical protein